MLYLLDKDVKTVKWNGIPLHEASSAIVKEETNGDFTLTVRYPITDTGIYQLIKEDMLIKAPTPVLGPQLFRIKKPVENDDSLDITAYHITDDVMQRSIRPVSVVGQGCAMALSQMVQNAKTDLGTFSFTSDIMDSRTFNTTETETLYSVLLDGKHSIVGTWEGELVRDNFAMSIKRSRGADRGVVITTHKNLKSYQRTKNSQSVVTRIHAKSTFKADGAEEETTITVTVDSPLIGNYPYINEKDYENNNAKTVDELRKWAEAKFKNEGIDKISDAIEIEAYELDGQVIHLGDTVNIKSKKHDVDLYKKAIAYEYNALTEEYISITFDDKPGVGGSGVPSGVSNAADAILSANRNTQEVAIERAIRNANQAFDAEFEKRVEEINDGIEQSKAEAERYADAIKQEIATEINDLDTAMQAQSEEHDRQVADILSKTQSVEALANQAKSDAASALARANQVKTEAIADARAQIASVGQALNTAKTEIQTAIANADQKARDSQASATALRTDLNLQASKILAQAQAQTALTSRVSTVENLADGTRSTVAELSKTVNKATGDIATVSSRTKTVEDTLSQTRTQYEALTQTVNAQTGQIDSINRKTADLQSGIDGVRERFENLRVGAANYIQDFGFAKNQNFNNNQSLWRFERIEDSTARSGYHIKATCTQAGGVGFHRIFVDLRGAEWQGRTMTYAVDIKASKSVRMFLGVEAFNNGPRTFDVTTSWQRFVSTDTVNLKRWYSFPFYADTITWAVGDIIYIRDPQLEDGTIATTPHAAEEDFRSEFATYVRNASENSAELVRRIETADGKAVEAKSYAQQTATAINTRLESLETYKDAEGTRASQYLTASRIETAKQIAAERTAIATDYVAKSTYTEDVRGTTQKLDEIKTTADTAKQNLATYQNTVDRKLEELTSSTQTLDGKINTASSKVDTVAGQIRTEISTVEGKIPTETSGNLLLNSGVGWSNVHDKTYVLGEKLLNGKVYTIASKYWHTSGSTGHSFNIGDGSWRMLTYSGALDCWVCTFTVNTDVPKETVIRIGSHPAAGLGSSNWVTLVKGSIALSQWQPAGADLIDELSTVKTTITQTSKGVEQLSTSLATTDDKITTAEAEIRNLVDEVSSKVSQTDYNTLTGRVDDNETAITQNATEISKRLTSTQVEKAITDKGYQTKSDVDNNITGRGYITSSALEPYALSTTVQNLVKETSDSFSRTISETKALIPTSVSHRNLIAGTSDRWSAYQTINVSSNWIASLGRVQFGDSSGIYVGSKVHLYVHVSADEITFDPAVTTRTMKLQGQILDSQNVWTWANQNLYHPFYNTWSSNLTTGNNYRLIKLTSTITQEMYQQSKGFELQVRIDGVKTGKFHVRALMVSTGDIFPAYWTPSLEDLATVTALHDVNDTVDSHTRTIGAVGTAGSILDNVSKVTQTAAGLVQEVSGENGLKTQVSTLAGSYAIKSLTKAGDVLGQINLNKDGSVKIDGKLVQITGKTYIEDGVITSAKIADLDAGKINTGELDAARIKANSIDGSKIVFDDAFFNGLTASEANINKLFAKDAFATSVQAVTLSASKIQGGVLEAVNSAVKMDLNNANITFNQNATINFNSANNALVRRKGTHTAFVHFNDVMSSSDGGVGSLYASIGVTSSGDGINSESSGRFAGLRAFRGARGLTHGATLDQLELYGDRVLFMDDFALNRGFMFRPAALSRDDFIDMNQLVTCVRALRDMWAHYKNSNGTLSDLLNNRSNQSVNASWENMHSFK